MHLESTVFRQKIEEHLCALCTGARVSVGPRPPESREDAIADPLRPEKLKDAIKGAFSLPAHMLKLLLEVGIAQAQLRAELGREPSPEEVAAKASCLVGQATFAMDFLRHFRLVDGQAIPLERPGNPGSQPPHVPEGPWR